MEIQPETTRQTAEATHADANQHHDKREQYAENDSHGRCFSQLPSQHCATDNSSYATTKEGDAGRDIAVFYTQQNSEYGQHDRCEQHRKKDQPIDFHWRRLRLD